LGPAALFLLGGATLASAQTVQLRDAGPGEGPRTLRSALATPHIVVPPAASALLLARDSTYPSTVIVLKREVKVRSHVRGDLIVIGADLYLEPGAQIEGRAIAIGGGVYNSTLAVSGDRISYRNFTYDVVPIPGGYALDYHALEERYPTPFFSWAGFYGFGLPLYDRSNGLSLRFGPLLSLDTGNVQVEPRITYRSNLGVWDPSVVARFRQGRRTRYRVTAGRGTFSNEEWIYGDLLNSASVLAIGKDTRNYYRADRAELTAHRMWEGVTASIEPYIGARYERGWSVGPGIGATGGPWAFHGRKSIEDILRPNPPVNHESIVSFLTGAAVSWESEGVEARLAADEELGWPTRTEFFAQTTLGGVIKFPTFGVQNFRLEGHTVLTAGSAARQRWAYLGGSGTYPFLELLEQGGAQLLYFDSRYAIPLERIVLPGRLAPLGPPVITLRHLLAGAGPTSLPRLEQAIGLRVSLSVLNVEILVDPRTGNGHFGGGISLAR
jgi:hypothetical protein